MWLRGGEKCTHIVWFNTCTQAEGWKYCASGAEEEEEEEKKGGEKRRKKKKKEKDPFFVYLLQGIMIVLRFISHVCLYGARGTTPGHVLGQSWQEGSSTEASTIVDSTENIDKM